jgi:hypothetical protein
MGFKMPGALDGDRNCLSGFESRLDSEAGPMLPAMLHGADELLEDGRRNSAAISEL